MTLLYTTATTISTYASLGEEGMTAIDASFAGFRGWASNTEEEAIDKAILVLEYFSFFFDGTGDILINEPYIDVDINELSLEIDVNEWVTNGTGDPALNICKITNFWRSGATWEGQSAFLTIYTIDSDYAVQYLFGLPEYPGAPLININANLSTSVIIGEPAELEDFTLSYAAETSTIGMAVPIPYTQEDLNLQMAFNNVGTFYPNPSQIDIFNKYKNGTSIIRGKFGESGERYGVVRPAVLGGFMLYEEVAGLPSGTIFVYNFNRRLIAQAPASDISLYLPIGI